MSTLWTAQTIDHRPPGPRAYNPEIALVGCGGVTAAMLAAYRHAGFNVTAFCDPVIAAATARRAEFFPAARVFGDHREMLAETSVEVVDVATHTAVRPPIVADCLRAGRHVLSQKPFVEDLELGEALCSLAEEHDVLLATNQNARWAPHFAYLRNAVAAGLLGALTSTDFAVHWSHDRAVSGSVFAEMPDLVLLDFGIHWFDLVNVLFAQSGSARRVFASVGRSTGQTIGAPTQAQVVIDFDDAQANLTFRAASPVGEEGRYRATGTAGVITSVGPALGGSEVEVTTIDGSVRIPLDGHWFRSGFQGAMGELLRAIEAADRPANAARTALGGLQLCFAAVASARDGAPIDPMTVQRLAVAVG